MVDPESKRESLSVSSRSTHARAAPAGRASAAAACEQDKCNPDKATALRIVSGILCWSEADQLAGGELVKIYGPDAVESAAQAFIAVAGGPLPGRVAGELQRRAAAAQAASRAAAGAARLARLEQESRRRGVEEMAAARARGGDET